MHSVTKYLNGHSDVVMGAAVVSDPALHERLRYLQNGFSLLNPFRSPAAAMGGIPGPFDCSMALRGLKTLHVRMRQHQENAIKVPANLKEL
jgi:cystathionine gamma-lyase